MAKLAGLTQWSLEFYQNLGQVKYNEANDREIERDPGLIFYFEDSNIIHECLNLSAIANLHPPLQRGKKKILVPFCYYPNFVGATERESKMNFYEWLHQVATSLNQVGSLAREIGGQYLRGVIDHLKQEQFAMLRGCWWGNSSR